MLLAIVSAKGVDKLKLFKGTKKGTNVGKEGNKKLDNLADDPWKERPVSGQTRLTPDGHRIMSVRDLNSFKREMEKINIKVIIDKKGKLLPDFAAAGFDHNKGQIILRKNPTYLSALHESYHAKQWRELGKEKYQAQTVLEREEYVYNEIMKNKDIFNAEEILFSQRYIYKLRNGHWPPPNWKGFEE